MKRHSNVMTIANRLVSQGMGRATAMIKAWVLVKMPLVETKVVGVTHGKRQQALHNLRQYSPESISIDLRRERDNKHDSNAIAVIATVESKGSYCMGYLPKVVSAFIAPLMDAGKHINSIYNNVRGGYSPLVCYGLAIKIII